MHRVSSFKRQSFQVSNFVGLFIFLLLKLTIEIMIVAIEIVVLQRAVCITEVIKNKREIFRAIVKK